MATTKTQNSTTPESSPEQTVTMKEKDAKNPNDKPSHPPTSKMVNNAIEALNERKGSSLQAIKKYIAANYLVDIEKFAPFIKKYIKASVESGVLVQKTGKGASCSFKLAPKPKTSKTASAPASSDTEKDVSPVLPKAKKVTVKVKKIASSSPKTKKVASSPKAKKVASSPKAKKVVTAPKAKKVTTAPKEEKLTLASPKAEEVASASEAKKVPSASLKVKKTASSKK